MRSNNNIRNGNFLSCFGWMRASMACGGNYARKIRLERICMLNRQCNTWHQKENMSLLILTPRWKSSIIISTSEKFFDEKYADESLAHPCSEMNNDIFLPGAFQHVDLTVPESMDEQMPIILKVIMNEWVSMSNSLVSEASFEGRPKISCCFLVFFSIRFVCLLMNTLLHKFVISMRLNELKISFNAGNVLLDGAGPLIGKKGRSKKEWRFVLHGWKRLKAMRGVYCMQWRVSVCRCLYYECENCVLITHAHVLTKIWNFHTCMFIVWNFHPCMFRWKQMTWHSLTASIVWRLVQFFYTARRFHRTCAIFPSSSSSSRWNSSSIHAPTITLPCNQSATPT